MITPVKNHIIIKFHDETSNGLFVEKTEWGFVTGKSYDRSGKSPRIADVVAIGPEVTEVKVGDVVYVEPLRWTNSLKHDHETFWRTDEDSIIGVVEQ